MTDRAGVIIGASAPSEKGRFDMYPCGESRTLRKEDGSQEEENTVEVPVYYGKLGGRRVDFHRRTAESGGSYLGQAAYDAGYD
jgi:hypothetical protein